MKGEYSMIHNLRINHDKLYGEDGTQPVSFVLTDRVIDKIKAQNELEMSQTAKTYYEKQYQESFRQLNHIRKKIRNSKLCVVLETIAVLLVSYFMPYHVLYNVGSISVWIAGFCYFAKKVEQNKKQYNRLFKKFHQLDDCLKQLDDTILEQENILDWLEHTKEHKRVILSQDVQKKEEEQYNRELEQMKIKYIDLFLNTPSYSQEEGKQYFHKMY